jgi:hypothetical protein
MAWLALIVIGLIVWLLFNPLIGIILMAVGLLLLVLMVGPSWYGPGPTDGTPRRRRVWY